MVQGSSTIVRKVLGATRSTKDLKFREREPHPIEIEFSPAERALYEAVTDYTSYVRKVAAAFDEVLRVW